MDESVTAQDQATASSTEAARPAAGPADVLVFQLPDTTGFKPIGPNLPLLVELNYVYTGKFPATILGSSPMLITSTMKNLNQSGAAAQAVNYLVPKVGKHTPFPDPPADQQGTKVICYVPAVNTESVSITFDMVFENFPDGAFQSIGSVFSGLASLPIFLTQSPYLVGAGAIIKLVQDIGDALFNGKPDFTPSIDIVFSGIGKPSTAGFTVAVSQGDDPGTDFTKFIFDQQNGLVDPQSNKPYRGDAPYFVIGVDGFQDDNLKTFAPLAASASILATFLNIKDGGTVPVSDILAVASAKSDVDFFKQGLAAKQEIAANPQGPNVQALQQQLKTAIANIQDPDLVKLLNS